jgi:hypothetical protein
MNDDDVIPIRKPVVVAEIGGKIDETRVTLSVHGDDLDPDEVSAILKCRPTRSHRRGESRPRNTSAWSSGAWLLSLEGKAPVEPEEVLIELLDRVPSDPSVWSALNVRFRVKIGFGLFLGAWNRGFELSPPVVSRAIMTGAQLGFDIYAGDAEDDG